MGKENECIPARFLAACVPVHFGVLGVHIVKAGTLSQGVRLLLQDRSQSFYNTEKDVVCFQTKQNTFFLVFGPTISLRM